MTRLHIRKYEPADFLAIECSEGAAIGREGQPVEEWARDHLVAGPAVTAVDPVGRIVFCIGLHVIQPGTAEVWATFSPLAAGFPLGVLRLVRLLLERFGGQYTRLHAVVDPSWSAAVRFVEHFGFKREALMRRYGPNGRDMALYARMKGGESNGS